MARDELSLTDQIGRADRLRAEAQVGNRHRAGFFRVIDEVALCIVVGFLADDLDAVLVGADGAVRAEAEEDRLFHAFGHDLEVRIVIERKAGDVVVDANGEDRLGVGFRQFVKDTLDHRRA